MTILKRLALLLAVALLASCGEKSGHFKIEGRLLQMNQGEFYVYSDNGDIDGIDTIKVQGGRFTYERACERPMTLIIVFPNYSVLPVYAESGKTVSIKGDASHLKHLEVKGSETNELMSTFREQIAEASPPETRRLASQFIADHPESVTGVFIVRHYFVAVPNPDYKEAARLTALMLKEQPENGSLLRLRNFLKQAAGTGVGQRLPRFSVKDMKGDAVTSAQLSRGLAVICTWATWSYESTDMLRQLLNVHNGEGKEFQVLAISVDGSQSDVKNYVRMNPSPWHVAYTGEMLRMKLLRQLAMLAVPDNIVVKDGRIVGRGLTVEKLMERIRNS